MTQYYAAASVCSPSRAGLLTGRYPWKVGVPNNAGPPPAADVEQLGDRGNPGLHDSAVTLAELFQTAGYKTGHVGKWHLGDAQGSRPNDQGFTSSFGHVGGCIDNYSHFFYWNGPNRHDLWRDGRRVRINGKYFLDLMAEEVLRLINDSKSDPFFVYWALNAPHYPYQADSRWLEHYAGSQTPRKEYAAFVSAMDERIGTVLDALEKGRLLENTIVLFLSDNGHSTEERAMRGGGNSGPYRGAKFSLFEGGIRLPAIVSWPRSLPKGESRDQIVHACDWMPTLCALAGVPTNEEPSDGHDLASVLRDPVSSSPRTTTLWKQGNRWAVRKGDWKLIYDPDLASSTPGEGLEEQFFLTRISQDPGETKNLARLRPKVVDRLRHMAATSINK